ncbi:MAG: vWA domain-containing protein [Planctomycetota bacterium]|jgi:hypothetical protein
MMKRYAFSLILTLVLAPLATAEITGFIVPDYISPVLSPGETQAFTVNYSSAITSGQGKADVLFLTDTTGSMGGYISGIRSAFGDILTRLDTTLPGVDIQYGVADYKDYRDFGNYANYGINLRQSFTSNADDVQSAMDSMYAVGGYDPPESQLKAMVNLANNWMTTTGDLGFGGRPDAQKIVIWAGDVEGHYYGEGGDGPPEYYPSLGDTLAALNTRGILTFGLNLANAEEGIDTEYGGSRQATYITEGTGGKLVNALTLTDAAIEAAIVDAVMTGIDVMSNITLVLDGEGEYLVDPITQTRIGAWNPADGDVTGSFTFEITGDQNPGDARFDMVLLGNGAEIDRVTIDLTTVPEPMTVLFLGLGGLGCLRKRRC